MSNSIRTLHFHALHVTDTHFSPLNKAPQSRSASYNDDVAFELNAFNDILKKEKPDCILFSGDFFHLKSQDSYNPGDINYYSKFLTEWDLPIYACPGNHDLPKASYDLVEKTAYRNLTLTVPKLFDLPWRSCQITKWETPVGPVVITGIPYFPLAQLFDKLKELDEAITPVRGFKIVLLHTDALPNDLKVSFFQTCSWGDLQNLLPHAHLLCLGHIHMSFPIYSGMSPLTGEPQFISKPWSFGRVVKDYFQNPEILEHQHKPSYADIKLYSEDGGPLQVEIEYKVIPHRPFSQIFNPESLKRELESSGKISQFIQSLRSEHGSLDNAFRVEDPQEYLRKSNIPDTVRALIEKYLEEV
jgi:hypothetical protein